MRRVTTLFLSLAVGATAIWIAPPVAAIRSQRSEPDARCCFGMARNPGGGVVLFGGLDPSNAFLGDTWTWDGGAWTERHPAHSPQPREAFSLVFDAARGQVVLFGGASDELFADTWTWDGEDWTKRDVLRSPPAACCYGMGYDTSTRLVVLFIPFNSQTWTWDGFQWQQRHTADAPHWRDSASQAARDGDHLVLFGGASCPELCDTFYRDTWTWDGESWTRVFPGSAPRARYGGAMAFDPATRTTVLFGGLGYRGFYGDTWEWDGAQWTRLRTGMSPGARYAVRMAYDSERRELVLFGGLAEGMWLGDTWTWDGVTWTEH